jgi:hypothetical protein
VVAVAFTSVVEQAYMVHSMLAGHRAEMAEILKSDVHDQLSTGIGQVLSDPGVMAVGGRGDSAAVGNSLPIWAACSSRSPASPSPYAAVPPLGCGNR